MIENKKIISLRSKYDSLAYRIGYNIFAPFYDIIHGISFLFHGGRYKFWKKVINSVDYKNSEKILDACCGTGFLTNILLKEISTNIKVHGIDISHNQIKIAKQKINHPNVYFKVSDARKIPYENNHFDKTFITFALHEMPKTVRKKILKELSRVTKNDGKIIILEGYKPTKRYYRILMFITFFQWFPWCVDRPHNKQVWSEYLVNEIQNCNMKILSRDIISNEFFQIIVAITTSKK